MGTIDLQAQERDRQRNPRQLRSAGLTPATLYGCGQAPQSLQVNAKQFAMEYKRGARSFRLGELNVVAKAHQVQFHPVSFEILNIEFLREANA